MIKRAYAGSFSGQQRCDVCGRPATWRTRAVTACCVYGETMCDRCNGKRAHLHRSTENLWVEVWRDWRELIASLRRKLGPAPDALPDRLPKQQDPKVPQPLTPIVQGPDD